MAEVIAEIAALLDGMIEHQRRRAFQAARRTAPGVTPEDILQPHDYPPLMNDAEFHFEDGQTSGLLSAKVAVISKLRELLEGAPTAG